MIPALRQQIEHYAERYAQMIHQGIEATPTGHERFGRLLGLCYAYRELVHPDTRAVRGMAYTEVENAQVRLGYVDEEGYAIEGAQ
jgi:hypothetical protein